MNCVIKISCLSQKLLISQPEHAVMGLRGQSGLVVGAQPVHEKVLAHFRLLLFFNVSAKLAVVSASCKSTTN